MRYTQENGKLLHKAEIAPGIYNFILSAPEIAQAAAAGPIRQCSVRYPYAAPSDFHLRV